MDTIELQKSLSGILGDRIRFKGIVPSDFLPKNLKDVRRDIPLVYIVNTLTSKADVNQMGHWVVFYVEKSPIKRIVFFDSYGLDPSLYSKNFVKFIESHKKTFTFYNWSRQIQPINSVKCGLYVVYFVHTVSHNGIESTLKKMLKIFKIRNKKGNDRFVTSYFFDHLNRMSDKNDCNYWRTYKTNEKRGITFKECKKKKKKK